MIGLGCFGVMGAIKMYKQKHNKRDRDLRSPKKEETRSLLQKTSSLGSNSGANGESDFEFVENDPRVESHGYDEVAIEFSTIDSERDSKPHVLIDHSHDHNHQFRAEDCPSWCSFIDMHDPYTQRIMSFSIGLLHGVAGPGGILGVLPAVEMRNYKSSFIYLSSFIVASTLSMGTFAALYGELTKRIGATAESIELALSVFSSAMSILVGTLWFVLSMLGKLEGLFH